MKNEIKFNPLRWGLSLGAAEFVTDRTFGTVKSLLQSATKSELLLLTGMIIYTSTLMAGLAYGTNYLLAESTNIIKDSIHKKKTKLDQIKELKKEALSIRDELTNEHDDDFSLKL